METNSYVEVIKQEVDETLLFDDIKIKDNERWLQQPVWFTSLRYSEPTFDCQNDVEKMTKLLVPSVRPCHICERRFVNRYNLLKHNLEHLVVKLWQLQVYQCNDCPLNFLKKNLLEIHQINEHLYRFKTAKATKMMHICQICNKTFVYKSWHHHMATVHASSVKCSLCDTTFKSSVYLKRHLKYVHEGDKPRWRFRSSQNAVEVIKCNECDITFHHPYSLKGHMKNVHDFGGSKECEICGSVLKSASYLRTHKQRVHYDDGKKHSCKICGKNFKSPRYLRVHNKNSHLFPYRNKRSPSDSSETENNGNTKNSDSENLNKPHSIKVVLKKCKDLNKKKLWKVVKTDCANVKKKCSKMRSVLVDGHNIVKDKINDSLIETKDRNIANIGSIGKKKNEFLSVIFGSDYNDNSRLDFDYLNYVVAKKEIEGIDGAQEFNYCKDIVKNESDNEVILKEKFSLDKYLEFESS